MSGLSHTIKDVKSIQRKTRGKIKMARKKAEEVRYWITRDHTKIPIPELEDSHLLNIIRWMERKMKKSGVCETVEYTGGCCDGYVDEIRHKGLDALIQMDYFPIIKEELDRKLVSEDHVLRFLTKHITIDIAYHAVRSPASTSVKELVRKAILDIVDRYA